LTGGISYHFLKNIFILYYQKDDITYINQQKIEFALEVVFKK